MCGRGGIVYRGHTRRRRKTTHYGTYTSTETKKSHKRTRERVVVNWPTCVGNHTGFRNERFFLVFDVHAGAGVLSVLTRAARERALSRSTYRACACVHTIV